jgi:2TM domain
VGDGIICLISAAESRQRRVPCGHVALVIHAATCVAVNALLVVVWAVGGDSDWSIGEAFSSPVSAARDEGFWPPWVMASWGVLLAIHAAVAVQVGSARRRRRRRARRGARRQRPVSPGASPLEGPPRRRWVAALFTGVVGSAS